MFYVTVCYIPSLLKPYNTLMLSNMKSLFIMTVITATSLFTLTVWKRTAAVSYSCCAPQK